MAVAETLGALSPVQAIALVGTLGVGAQWLAWRMRMPAIVLMLAAGIVVGPVLGLFDPMRDIGPLTGPLISIAVAVILFEGGLTLNLQSVRDAAEGVRRLVFIGAPLGWLMSALALRYGAGLSWESSAVFGGIMVVTGPTVIAPLLRQARLQRRPAALLQWEAIVNDPIGALAAVLAFQVVQVMYIATEASNAALEFAFGLAFAGLVGAAAGYGLAQAFRRAWVPEYMKVPVLFVLLVAVFAGTDAVLHESGLLAVTVMGIVIANSDLPSFDELRRFKEHATVLLVSGVFILLAAGLDFSSLGQLDWRAGLFVLAVVLVARPVTVFLSLLGSKVPMPERVLVAATGPRGVVLVAVASLFGERLVALGVADGALIGPLAFTLVAVTVVLHGFSLAPVARALGLSGGERPGVLVVGASPFTIALGEALKKAEVPVLIADPNRTHLRAARLVDLPTFFGDILSEAAEHSLELTAYKHVLVATDNDAYNTLVATDLAPEFGRANVFQIRRENSDSRRHALPSTLGGKPFGGEATLSDLEMRIRQGWRIGSTRLTREYDLAAWRADRPEAELLALVRPSGDLRMVDNAAEADLSPAPGSVMIAMRAPGTKPAARAEARAGAEPEESGAKA